ncbi:hypothetical protein Caci_0874 [Catenulispora acidiphila DSM 44928]|uniref:Uncharacterized protein n=1 Tax=Catenulispora acidiphila (strain DSM 44928 / JCM 14897 / NBRC 102108 / NRRL B-24433 / ID139908) TaxID=479433 RepID=C7Q2G5_CATAD|nr:hypothetical protein [Catenulispora acidiphila]ACU69807.1 hypothetical protein Caci_0874 [Catenulispora acidiphila DSM 44928]
MWRKRGTSNRDEFGHEVAERIRAASPESDVEYSASDFTVAVKPRSGTGAGGVLSLKRFFAEREGLDEDGRRAQIDRLVAIVTAPSVPEGWAEVRPMLMPVPRRADFGLADGRDPLLSRPFAPCLSELVVVDQKDRMGYVKASDPAQWGVTADDVFEAAHANLTAQFSDILDRRTDAPSATSFMGAGHTYMGSLPLLDGWLATWAAGWEQRPLVFLTEFTGMLICPEPADPTELKQRLADAEQEWTRDTRSISPVAYTTDDSGRIVPYDVPADHPARAAVRRSWALLAADTYATQTKLLRSTSDDPFIAALQLFSRSDDGLTFTLATWSANQPSLLPPADWIAFAGEGDDHFFLPWDAVAAEVDLIPEPGYHPTRYLVEAWPDPKVMARLRAQAGMP